MVRSDKLDASREPSSGGTVPKSSPGVRDLDGAAVLGDFWTPLIVVSRDRLEHNARFLADWCAGHGIELMPHGKTTMAPDLWRLQEHYGASGITVATPWQMRVALESGIDSVQLANQLTDPSAIRWLVRTLTERAGRGRPVRVFAWIDDERTVGLIEGALGDFPGDAPQLEVLVDLGRPGARTGARSLDQARRVARSVHDSPRLRLAGVSGYEGALVHGRSGESLAQVASYLDDLLRLHDEITPLYDEGEVIVTAGGSAFPDAVGQAFAGSLADPVRHPARYVLRSGAYLVHDDGFYKEISPFTDGCLLPAVRGLARVVSQPEPGLALLDAGKRDFPYDEGMPVPLAVQSSGLSLKGAEITAVNDQHSFMRVPGGVRLSPGDVVVLGLSHPCTMFDKWRKVPVVPAFGDADGDLPLPSDEVTGYIETVF